MNAPDRREPTAQRAELIRVRGLVQGVGFRPTVWRLAQQHALRGSVINDGQGVRIHVCGTHAQLDAFALALCREAPPLARVEHVEREHTSLLPANASFTIDESQASAVHTGVVADAATCEHCRSETFDPFNRRYRYPFINCTHCGPRLSIVEGIPYDRSATTMRGFTLCPQCRAEYEDPADRRFHAQPTACHACGPRATLERADGAAIALDSLSMLDAVDAACTLLQRGQIVAIKGLGGFQLACDATKPAAVERLRAAKRRYAKPFALMARDIDIIRRYARVSEQEVALLRSPAAPIAILDAILDAEDCEPLASTIAQGLRTLGFMLPNTPLHHLMLRRMTRPIVLTSGNLSDEPQCIGNDEARARLGGIAEYFLLHDRDIARRVDDSVTRVIEGVPRVLRRARGYAPAPIVLPRGFDAAPPVLAMGGELKNSFCLLAEGRATVSHHMGDLENAPAFADYRQSLANYAQLFEHRPEILAVDLHPEYLSTKLGREMAAEQGLRVSEVQHHHAHIASCMAENGVALEAGPVIGVALDGLGYGDGGELWGGEFLLADYRRYTRMATFKPVAMLGGARAMHEPWRNTYAQLMAEMGWSRFAMNYEELDLFRFLDTKPRALLEQMRTGGVNSPLASSCGRLFDAVAAAAGVCRERALYEGQAAVEFEALVDVPTLFEEDDALAYPLAIPRLRGSNLPYVEPLPMWQAMLGDLILRTPVPVIAARFHKGLAIVIARMVEKLSRYESGADPIRAVCLSGGVFQNGVLFEQVSSRLRGLGFTVLSPAQLPANDGGLSLGQAAIGAARAIPESRN